MDRTTKILIVIAIIIAILVVAGIGYLIIVSDKSEADIDYNEVVEKVEELNENEIDEEENDENENEDKEQEENTVVEEVSEDPEANKIANEQQVVGREEQQSVSQYNQKTDEEKVLELAKKKWGENDNTVSFNIVNREDNIYTVSVNNKNTTAVLVWYQVNLSTGEVSQ